jgi:hypothetical protein
MLLIATHIKIPTLKIHKVIPIKPVLCIRLRYLHNSNVHLLRFAEIIVPITETDSIILLYRFAGMFMFIVKQKTFSCMSPIQPINTLVLRS